MAETPFAPGNPARVYAVGVDDRAGGLIMEAAQDGASTDDAESAAFAGEERAITFKPGIFIKYYAVDLLDMLIPLASTLVGPLVWGKIGARNMQYLPRTARDLFVMLFLVSFFQTMFILPVLETIFVLTDVHPDSNFNVMSEGLFVLLFVLLAPAPSAFKYAFMSTKRFQHSVLGSDFDDDMMVNFDRTVDSIQKWNIPFKDDLIQRQLRLAFWRSGNFKDRTRLRFSTDDDDNSAQQDITLETIVHEAIRRHKGAGQAHRKLRMFLYFTVFIAIALTPALYRRFALDAPMFGHDNFEIAACVCSLLVIALSFVANSGYILKMRAHLIRDRCIMEEYASLIAPKLGADSNGQDPIARIKMTAHNVRVWGRGREALLSFGSVYWLRNSLTRRRRFLR